MLTNLHTKPGSVLTDNRGQQEDLFSAAVAPSQNLWLHRVVYLTQAAPIISKFPKKIRYGETVVTYSSS